MMVCADIENGRKGIRGGKVERVAGTGGGKRTVSQGVGGFKVLRQSIFVKWASRVFYAEAGKREGCERVFLRAWCRLVHESRMERATGKDWSLP